MRTEADAGKAVAPAGCPPTRAEHRRLMATRRRNLTQDAIGAAPRPGKWRESE